MGPAPPREGPRPRPCPEIHAPFATSSRPEYMHAFELVNVTKHFGAKVAVDNLSLRVDTGSFLGLLGRNGAGKSTTLKMLMGLIRPTSGSIRVLDMSIERDDVAIKRQVGVLAED